MGGSIENRCHIRSISFPPRSNPTALKIEEELNNLKNTWETISTFKSKTIQMGLTSLIELYDHVDDLIRLPLTQQALTYYRNEKVVEDVLDESVRLLDACCTSRDFLSVMKEGVQDLQSALRRKSGGESSIEAKVSEYICLRKKVKKDINKSLSDLKRTVNNENKFISSSKNLIELEQHLLVVVKVLREVTIITVSIYRSLLSFMSAQSSKSRPSRWSLVSKLLQKGKSSKWEQQEEECNEVLSADIAVHGLCDQNITSKDAEEMVERVKMAQRRLKDLEVSIEDVEEGVGCMYKRLIKTRVTLLNIFTH